MISIFFGFLESKVKIFFYNNLFFHNMCSYFIMKGFVSSHCDKDGSSKSLTKVKLHIKMNR